jgi:hypothetical protein
MMENAQIMEVPGEEDDKGESSKETQAPNNSDFRLKSILETLKQIHTIVLDEVCPKISTSGLEIEEAKGRNDVSPNETKLEMQEALESKSISSPQKLSLDAVSEATGRNELWLSILSSGLEIEEDDETGGESKGTNEASQRMSTSTETRLEIELAKGMPEESSMDKVLTEEESFDLYRRGWVSNWSALCGTFTETSE